MPRIIVRDRDGQVRPVKGEPFAYEEMLERVIAEIPHLLWLETVGQAVSLATIGRQWPVGGGAADVVLVGSDGIITIVETKLKRNPEARREVIAQVLEYAAYLSSWSILEIQARATAFLNSDAAPKEMRGETFDTLLEGLVEESDSTVDQLKERIEKNLRQGRVRLVVAVDEVGEQALRIVNFVNSYSSFDIFLLQIGAYTDEGIEIFVPSLYGYAPKVSGGSRAPREEWTWQRYEAELGWTAPDIEAARRLLQKLLLTTPGAESDPRLHAGWISVRSLGREVLGVGVSKKRGLHLWFPSAHDNPISPPQLAGIRADQTKSYLYLTGDVLQLSDQEMVRLCRQSLQQTGLVPPADPE